MNKKTKLKDRINHSVAGWCFTGDGKMTLDELCQNAKRLGAKSVELVSPADFPVLEKHGLICAIGLPVAIKDKEPPFVRGWNDRANHEALIAKVGENIKSLGDAGFPATVVFTGYGRKFDGSETSPTEPLGDEIGVAEGIKTCVVGLKKLVSLAEQKKVVVCLEHLNTRDNTHPMKGHPGYWGNDLAVCAEIVTYVNSPWVRLLFDIYHVQVMHGDVIRRIRQCAALLGHVHTAGCPGRGELDPNAQEISYPAVMRALVDVGYKGFVGHEFIPTGDAKKGLAQAIKLCDV
ncbi:TIM barrel protein [Candidatus Woesearchaeota archaeon]|nr:TIM barrel protein [Candidatus Woesearchaeota archaeon]